MGSMRRLLLSLVAVCAVFAPSRAFAAAPPDTSGGSSTTADATTTTLDNSFLDTKRDITECLNNSIDLPDCGVTPKQAGDRGGALQGVTFGLLALAIAFICWRVTRAIRARDRELASRVS
jgi:hypothetical protein